MLLITIEPAKNGLSIITTMETTSNLICIHQTILSNQTSNFIYFIFQWLIPDSIAATTK